MNPSTAERLIHEATADTTYADRVLAVTRRRLVGFVDEGFGAGGDKARVPGVSDPTYARAFPGDRARKPDGFGHDLAELDEQLTILAGAAAKVRGILERHQAQKADPMLGEPGCHLCGMANQGNQPHPNRWQPVHARMILPSTPAAPTRGVCKFHYDFIGRYRLEPATAITVWHLDHLGDKIPKDLLQDHHLKEWRAHEQTKRKPGPKSDRVGEMGRATMGSGWTEGNSAA